MSTRDSPAHTDPDAHAAALGIHRIELDTPFAVGTVNVYLIEDDPLTLIDCGPNLASGLNDLEDHLRELGHAVDDLELLVVTHQHIDHTGLAGPLSRRVDLEVACLDVMGDLLENWSEQAVRSDEDAHELMVRHGVEAHIADALRSVSKLIRGYGSASPVHRRLHAGETLALRDRSFTIAHRPGHSPSDTVLHDRATGVALVGDHVLSRISSNALVERPLGEWDGRRPEPLLQYRSSLEATARDGIAVALTGHGPPVTDVGALIEERLDAQRQRSERFYEMLEAGPASAHELAVRRWGDVAITEAFLTLSEVLGHLGLLLADGRIVEDRSEPVVRFHRN